MQLQAFEDGEDIQIGSNGIPGGVANVMLCAQSTAPAKLQARPRSGNEWNGLAETMLAHNSAVSATRCGDHGRAVACAEPMTHENVEAPKRSSYWYTAQYQPESRVGFCDSVAPFYSI